MKQNVSPPVAITIIAVAVLALAFFAYRTYTGPSARAVNVSRAEVLQSMRRTPPTDAERKELEEWKRTHPGAYTTQ